MGRVFFNTRENLDTDSLTGTTTYVDSNITGIAITLAS